VVGEKYNLNDKSVLQIYHQGYGGTIDAINERMSGVSMIRRGAFAWDPQINGFSAGQLNVTIDGMKIFGACTDRMDPVTSYIEPINLKSIQIQQGSNACETGCNVGGSMNMQMCDGFEKPFSLRLASGYESVSNGRQLLVQSGAKIKQTSFGLSGVYRKHDNYKTATDEIVPFSQYSKSNYHAQIKHDFIGKTYLKLDAIVDIGKDIGYAALPMDVSLAKATILGLEYHKRYNSGKLKSWTAKVYFNKIVHIMDDTKRDSLFSLNGKHQIYDSVYMHMDMPGRSQTHGAYLSMNFSHRKKHLLTVKTEYFSNFSEADMTMYMHYPNMPQETPMYLQTWMPTIRSSLGMYALYTYVYSNQLQYKITARVDGYKDVLNSVLGKSQFSVFGYQLHDQYDRFAPAFDFGFNYKPNTLVDLGANIGCSQRPPTITELFGYFLFNAYDGYDYIGNPELNNEKLWFASFKIELKTAKLQLNTTPNISKIENYILGETQAEIQSMNFKTNGVRQYYNQMYAILASLPVQLRWEITSNFYLLNITKYTYAKLYNENPLPLIAPLKNYTALIYRLKAIDLRIESETAAQQNRINSMYGESVTQGFTIFHVNCHYSLQLSKNELNLSVGIQNLRNKKYYEHLDWGKIDRQGRNFIFYLEYVF